MYVVMNYQNHQGSMLCFHVAHIGLPYNAILGYPALAKFKAATHPGYNIIKMPGSSGIISGAGDTRDAVQALRLAYKVAAATRSGAGDAAQAPGAEAAHASTTRVTPPLLRLQRP